MLPDFPIKITPLKQYFSFNENIKKTNKIQRNQYVEQRFLFCKQKMPNVSYEKTAKN